MTLPNLYHLKYFVDAIDLQSMSEAARRNRVTHPAISRAIKALEEQMDLQLFVHQKKLFEPTKAGLKLAEQARALLEASTSFQEGRLSTGNPFHGKVRLGLSRTLGHAYLKTILNQFKKKMPEVHVQVDFGATAAVQEGVANGSLDFALSIGAQSMPTLKQSVLAQGHFVLVESRQSKRRQGSELGAFILTEPRYETELLKRAYRKKFDTNAEVSYEIKSWDMIAELAAEDFGIGLVPEISLRKEKNLALRILKTDWFECEYEVVLQEQRLKDHSLLQRTASEILKGCF